LEIFQRDHPNSAVTTARSNCFRIFSKGTTLKKDSKFRQDSPTGDDKGKYKNIKKSWKNKEKEGNRENMDKLWVAWILLQNSDTIWLIIYKILNLHIFNNESKNVQVFVVTQCSGVPEFRFTGIPGRN